MPRITAKYPLPPWDREAWTRRALHAHRFFDCGTVYSSKLLIMHSLEQHPPHSHTAPVCEADPENDPGKCAHHSQGEPPDRPRSARNPLQAGSVPDMKQAMISRLTRNPEMMGADSTEVWLSGSKFTI